MKNLPYPLRALVSLLCLGLAGGALAQTNTETFSAELNNTDRRDISISENFSPFGNKTELNRHGDDGSAAIVDASGVIIWRSSGGVYRVLPNTAVAKPLFVTNSECIVWRNAFEPVPNLRQRIEISYFRVDSESGAVRETTVPVDGNIVFDTARITTSTIPFTLVTANVENLPPVNNLNENKNFFVYRLTYESTTPQLLAAYSYTFIFGGIVNGPELIPYFKKAESIAAGADGSYVVRLVSEFYEDTDASGAWEDVESFYLWVRSDGSVKPLLDSGSPDGESAARTYVDGDVSVIQPVELSNAKFVFRKANIIYNADDRSFTFDYSPSQFLQNYSRSQVLDQIQEQEPIDLGKECEIPDLKNFTLKGFDSIFLGKNNNLLTVFKLEGDTAQELFEVTLPKPLGTDLTAFAQNSNPGSESFAIRDPNNGGVLWLHGQGADGYTLVPDSEQGRPLFVTPRELIVWNNSFAATQPDGSLPPALVTHYGLDDDAAITETPVKVVFDGTDPNAIYPGPVRGSQVFSPFPFTQDPALWKLETGEKIAGNTLRIRRYQLLSPDLVDFDGDGIRGGFEKGPFYIIPGTFSYEQAKTDAARRGGRLASLANPAEFDRMQASILLWQRNSPLPLPLREVPYPLWIGLEKDGAWKWSDGSSDAFIASNWAAGEPSAMVGRIRGRLTSTQQWQAANPTMSGGYLLELPVTDPLAKDTDGDGASDYDELFRLLTDPTVPNFVLTGGAPVDFKNKLVNGTYEGFLTDLRRGPISSFTLQVSSVGSFTGRIQGATGSGSVRGKFDTNGVLIMLPVKFGGGFDSYLSLKIAPDPVTGLYRVGGSLTGNPDTNGAPLVIELRRAAYNKAAPSPDAGSYTISIPSAAVAKEGQPNGDGYLIGTISTNGLARLRGYSSDGHALSWSGSVLEGDFLAFYSALGRGNGFANSNLFLRKSAEVDPIYGLVSESDIDGDLLVVRNTTFGTASQYYAGFNFRSRAYGSVYRKVSYSQLGSFSEFVAQPNNSILKFVDGIFSGQDVVTTWATNNRITTPRTQTRSLSASINSSTGEMRGSYSYRDPALNYANSVGKFGGVVLQKSGEVRGYYTGGTVPGRVLLQPNLDGSVAPVNLISPRSNDVPAEGQVYQIYVTSSEPWRAAVLPPDISPYSPFYSGNPESWITVNPISGVGNGVVTVTVSRNTGWYGRAASVVIAGLKHKIEQKNGLNSGTNEEEVSISPLARAVPAAGETYLVQVKNYKAKDSANPQFDFLSLVGWVTVEYVPGNLNEDGSTQGIARVTVAPNPGANNGYIPRTANITIAGLIHRVAQEADNPYSSLNP